MTHPMDDDALLTLLKDDAHLPDGGFTDRVMTRLPRRRRTLGRRELVVGASALLAAGVGALAWAHGAAGALALASSGLGGAAALALVVGLGLWGALSAASSEA